MSNGPRNKAKGSHAERFYANVFKDLGYTKCVTARLGSRLHDNAGIDIINIPYNIQIKAGVQQNMNSGKVLLNTYIQIRALFPEEDPVYQRKILLIHRKKAFSKQFGEDIVYMNMFDYTYFRDKAIHFNSEVLQKVDVKVRKNPNPNDYNVIIGVKMEEFYNKVLKNKIS